MNEPKEPSREALEIVSSASIEDLVRRITAALVAKQVAADEYRRAAEDKISRYEDMLERERKTTEGLINTAMAERDAKQAEIDCTYRDAKSLCISMTRHFTDNPEWKPISSTTGVLSQISNMVAGITKENENLKTFLKGFQIGNDMLCVENYDLKQDIERLRDELVKQDLDINRLKRAFGFLYATANVEHEEAVIAWAGRTKAEIEHLKTTERLQDQEIERLNNSIRNGVEREANLQSEVSAKQGYIERLESVNDGAASEIDRLQKFTQKALSQINELVAAQLVLKQVETDRLKADLAEAEQQAGSLRAELATEKHNFKMAVVCSKALLAQLETARGFAEYIVNGTDWNGVVIEQARAFLASLTTANPDPIKGPGRVSFQVPPKSLADHLCKDRAVDAEGKLKNPVIVNEEEKK